MGGQYSYSKPKEVANVYIFNRIKNNLADIKLLTTTFESLMCVVSEIEVQNKTYSQLKDTVNEIVKADFKEYKYIVIFILDNENEDEYIWITKDGKNFHINGDLLTAICANKSLQGKFRFFIFQTNRVSSEKINRREFQLSSCKTKFYPAKDLRYYATSTGCVLKHEWKMGEPSPFIRLLCDGIDQNVQLPIPDQLTIVDLLDKVSKQKTNDYPSWTNLSEPFVLGNAKECLVIK